MRSIKARVARLTTMVAAMAAAIAVLAPAASASVRVSFDASGASPPPARRPSTTRSGVLKIGPREREERPRPQPGHVGQRRVLRAARADDRPKAPDWQVWAVERRENLLEDHSVLDRAKAGQGDADSSCSTTTSAGSPTRASPTHFQLIPDADVGYAREWGMRVEIEDLRRVVEAREEARPAASSSAATRSAARSPRRTRPGTSTARPAPSDLDGLVFIDGGSGPTPVSRRAGDRVAAGARRRLAVAHASAASRRRSPASSTRPARLGALLDPDSPSIGQAFPLLPANLKPPIPVDEPRAVRLRARHRDLAAEPAAAQAHLGQLAASGDPRGWDQAGEITPIQRFADMFSGTGLKGLDGTAWYHPQRLTIDSGAVAAGNANPAQAILDVRATHGHDLPKRLRIYAFGAALGGQRVLDAATILAEQSGIPTRNLTLIDRHETYSHNDPNSASPKNDFVDGLVRFLGKIGKRRRPPPLPPLGPRSAARSVIGRAPQPCRPRSAARSVIGRAPQPCRSPTSRSRGRGGRAGRARGRGGRRARSAAASRLRVSWMTAERSGSGGNGTGLERT